MTPAEALVAAAAWALPDLIKFAEDIASLVASKSSGETREQAVEASRDADRLAVDALETAETPK